MAPNCGELKLPDNKKNKRGLKMNTLAGVVPSRLVYLWQHVLPSKLVQVVFEWEAPWPDKYVIECHVGPHTVARSSGLPWETVFEFLFNAHLDAGGNLPLWYDKVLTRLRAEGGEIHN